MWKIALIGQESSLNVTIQDILNQQSHFDCETIHFDVFIKTDEGHYSQDTDVIIADLTSHHYFPIGQIETIRSNFPELPILAIHLLKSSNIRRDLTLAGVNRVLSPDLSEDELINTVHNMISEHY